MKRRQTHSILIIVSTVFLLVFSSCEQPDSSFDLAGIERRYYENGPNAVAVTSVPGFKIFHPAAMTGNHPIITWGNGTAAPVFVYNGFLGHLASWGFVVVATQSVMTITGLEMISGIDYLLTQNSTPDSKFYKMLDIENIGSTGHSQGGGGAINAAVLDRRIKCCAPLAPAPGTTQFLYIPMFIVVGENDNIATINWVTNSCFKRAISPTIFAIASNTNHFSFTLSGGMTRGYVTAWFRHHLQNDSTARQAFAGKAELFDNPNWDVFEKNWYFSN